MTEPSGKLIKRPPTLAVIGAGTAAFAAIIVATSGPSADLVVFAAGAFVGLVALVVAVLVFLQALDERFQVRRASAVVVAGVILASLAFELPARGTPASIRFALSRSALDVAAARALGGESVGAGWIGLYPVIQVTRTSTTRVEFDLSVDASGYPSGFLYVVGNAPEVPSLSGGFDMRGEDLGGGWWTLFDPNAD